MCDLIMFIFIWSTQDQHASNEVMGNKDFLFRLLVKLSMDLRSGSEHLVIDATIDITLTKTFDQVRVFLYCFISLTLGLV